jgi:ketosteroid isomerase-like protein
MTQENVDLVRSIYAAWERGDFRSAEWAGPEMLYEYADGPSPGIWNGLEGMAEGFRDFLGAWKDWGVVADDFLELAGGRVLVGFHFTGSGKASGLDISRVHTNGATLFVVAAGRITRVVQYLDRGRALADLGLKD